MTRPAIGFKPVLIALDGRQPGGAKRAKWNGELKRAPRAGELYLSGARVVAYRAKVDFSSSYFIANEVAE
jgi:hypothetical protein